MSKETAVIVLGFLILVMPYLGVPRAWLTILMVLAGLGLMMLGFFLRAAALSRGPRASGRDHSFVEHVPHLEHLEHEVHQENHERKEKLSSLN